MINTVEKYDVHLAMESVDNLDVLCNLLNVAHFVSLPSFVGVVLVRYKQTFFWTVETTTKSSAVELITVIRLSNGKYRRLSNY